MMTRNFWFGGLWAVAMALASLPSANASIHAPVGFKDAVTETSQQALLFHDGKLAHLILKTTVRCPAGLPPSMAWVIPLPAGPLHQETLGPELFRELGALTGEEKMGAATAGPRAAAPRRYHVDLIHIEGAGSAPVLDRWLASNRFKPSLAEEVQSYLRPGNVLAVVKLQGLVGTQVELPPLHLIFDSSVLTLPLKSSAGSGVFNLTLYIITAQRLPMIAMRHYKMYGSESLRLTSRSAAPVLLRMLGTDPGYLTRFNGENFNTPGRFVKDLDGDPTIAADGAH